MQCHPANGRSSHTHFKWHKKMLVGGWCYVCCRELRNAPCGTTKMVLWKSSSDMFNLWRFLSALEINPSILQCTSLCLGYNPFVLSYCESFNRKDYSGEYTVFLVPCTVQPTQPWIDPGDKPLSCTAHAPEKYVLADVQLESKQSWVW